MFWPLFTVLFNSEVGVVRDDSVMMILVFVRPQELRERNRANRDHRDTLNVNESCKMHNLFFN